MIFFFLIFSQSSARNDSFRKYLGPSTVLDITQDDQEAGESVLTWGIQRYFRDTSRHSGRQ